VHACLCVFVEVVADATRGPRSGTTVCDVRRNRRSLRGRSTRPPRQVHAQILVTETVKPKQIGHENFAMLVIYIIYITFWGK